MAGETIPNIDECVALVHVRTQLLPTFRSSSGMWRSPRKRGRAA